MRNENVREDSLDSSSLLSLLVTAKLRLCRLFETVDSYPPPLLSPLLGNNEVCEDVHRLDLFGVVKAGISLSEHVQTTVFSKVVRRV